jgi:uncharacterized membrane protein
MLTTYLMFAFMALAAWRVLLEIWIKVKWTRLVYLLLAVVALCGLLYQGKTGGELVYEHAVGTFHADITSQGSANMEK